jgi:O-antigen ligase
MTNNLLSSVLIISIPIWVTLLSNNFNQKGFLRSLLTLFIFCVSILLIFLDKSRGAFIVLIFYLVIFILRFLLSSLANPKNQFRNQSYLMSFTIIVILALGFIFLGEVVVNRMTGLNTGQFSFKDIIETTFLSARGLTITQGFQEFLNSPFFGKGYGNGLMYIPTFGIFLDSHNLIIEHLVATGIFGITPIFYLLVSAFLSSVKSRRKLTSHDKDLIFSLWLSIAGFFLFGVTSGSEFIAAYAIKTAYCSYTLLLFLIAIMTITENRRKFR